MTSKQQQPQQQSHHAVSSHFRVLAERYIYNPDDEIGCGSTCRVFRGVELESGRQIALKYLSAAMDVRQEIRALMRLNHVNIVQLVEHLRGSKGGNILVMEFCNLGSLHHQIELHNGVNDDWLLAVVKCLYHSYQHLRENKLIHRDIKPGNLLVHLDNAGQLCVKLGDLGSSIHVANENARFVSLRGTPEFLHPDLQSELVSKLRMRNQTGEGGGENGQDTAHNRDNNTSNNATGNEGGFSAICDLWSIAITLYHAICNELPFVPIVPSTRLDLSQELMLQMYRLRLTRQQCIRGRQVEISPMKVDWGHTLPDDHRCKLSRTLRPHVERMLLKLMQQQEEEQCTAVDMRRLWNFSDFFKASDRLLQLVRVPVFHVNSGELELVYLSGGDDVRALLDAIKLRWPSLATFASLSGSSNMSNSHFVDGHNNETFFLFHPKLGLLIRPCAHIATANAALSKLSECRLESVRTGQSDLRLASLMHDCFFVVEDPAAQHSAIATSEQSDSKELAKPNIVHRSTDMVDKTFNEKIAYSTCLLTAMYAVHRKFRRCADQIVAYQAGVDAFLHTVLTAHYLTPANEKLRVSRQIAVSLATKTKESDGASNASVGGIENWSIQKLIRNIDRTQEELDKLNKQIIPEWRKSEVSTQLTNMILQYETSMEHTMKEMQRLFEEIKLLLCGPAKDETFDMEIWPRYQRQKNLYETARKDVADNCSNYAVMVKSNATDLITQCFAWIDRVASSLSDCDLSRQLLLNEVTSAPLNPSLSSSTSAYSSTNQYQVNDQLRTHLEQCLQLVKNFNN